MTSCYILYEKNSETWHIQNPVYYRKFRHIQACIFTPYSDIFRHIVTYLEPCTLYNSCIFCIALYNSAIFSILVNLKLEIYSSVKACSGIFKTLCNAPILQTLPYSELMACNGVLTPHPSNPPPPSPQTFYPPSPSDWKCQLLHFSHMATFNKHMFIFLKLL